jgi:hypothetical protein
MRTGPTSSACPSCTAQAARNALLRQQITRLHAEVARLQAQVKTLQARTLPVSMFDFCRTPFCLFIGGEKLVGDDAIAGLHGPRWYLL